MITVPGRRKDLRPLSGKDAPGAGSYEPADRYTRRSMPHFSMGRSRRDGEIAMYLNTPGVGSYFNRDSVVKGHSPSWR